jgi:hypothetical protein
MMRVGTYPALFAAPADGNRRGRVSGSQHARRPEPAGQLLRTLLAEAGIPESRFYITNAVKHFSFELRGKRRLHKTPLQRHVAACIDWLEREIASRHRR